MFTPDNQISTCVSCTLMFPKTTKKPPPKVVTAFYVFYIKADYKLLFNSRACTSLERLPFQCNVGAANLNKVCVRSSCINYNVNVACPRLLIPNKLVKYINSGTDELSAHFVSVLQVIYKE